MERDELTVMIVGLGRMGLAHAAVIQMIPGARVAALVDRDRGLGRMAASMGLRAPFYESAALAAKRERPRVAYLCTPTFTHAPLVSELAPRGVHLFVEKPLAHAVFAAESMTKAARRAGVRTAVGYNLRFERLFRAALDRIDRGAIGAVRRYRASAHHSEVFKPREGWLFDPERSGGGAVTNIGSHLIDYVARAAGPIATVRARCRSLHSPRVEDEGRLAFEHASGAEGELDISWSVPDTPVLAFRARFEGDGGVLEVDRRELRLHLSRPHDDLAPGEHRFTAADVTPEAAYDFSPEYGGDGYYAESAAFLDACARGADHPVDFEAGLAVERALAAVYRSSDRDGAPEFPGAQVPA